MGTRVNPRPVVALYSLILAFCAATAGSAQDAAPDGTQLAAQILDATAELSQESEAASKTLTTARLDKHIERLVHFQRQIDQSRSDSISQAREATLTYIEQIERAGETVPFAYPSLDAPFLAEQAALQLYNLGRIGDALTRAQAAIDPLPAIGQMQVRLRLLRVRLLRVLGEEATADDELRWLEAIDLEEAPSEIRAALSVDVPVQRALLMIQVGLPELAAPGVRRFAELAREDRDQPNPRARFGDAMVLRIDLEGARGDLDAMIRIRRELRADDADWKACGTLAQSRIDLRAAIALAENEILGKLAPAAEDPVPMLRGVIDGAALPENDRQLARAWLCDLLITRGRLEDAHAALAAFEHATIETATPRDRLRALSLHLALQELGGETGEAARRSLGSLKDRWHQEIEGWRSLGDRHDALAMLHFLDRTDVLCAIGRAHLRLDGDGLGAARALEEVMLAQEIGSLALSVGATAPSLIELRSELLGPREGGVLYLPGRRGSLMLLMDAEGALAVPIARHRDIKQATRALEFALARAQNASGDAAWKGVVKALYQIEALLFPDSIRTWIARHDSLAFIAPSNADYFPIEALHFDEGEPLGYRMPIRYLPSLPLAAWLAERRSPLPDPSSGNDHLPRDEPPRSEIDYALFSAGDPGSAAAKSLDRLPLTSETRRVLTSPFGPSGSIVVHDAACTAEALAGLISRRPQLMTLIGHGAHDPTSPRPARLILADNDDGYGEPILGGEWIEELGSAPPSVFLGVCGAWSGPRRRGDDGRSHLSGALLLRGSDEVIQPAVRIKYQTAIRLAKELNVGMRIHGLGASQALLRARRLMLAEARSEEQRLAPLLVHLIGLGDRPPFPH